MKKLFLLPNQSTGLLLLTFELLLFCLVSFAQQSKIDSLQTCLKKTLHACPEPCLGDTDRVNTLNALGWELRNSNPDTAIILGNQALALCEQLLHINHQPSTINHLKANTLGNLGVYNYLKADYPKSLDYFLKALKMDEELNNKSGIAKRLGNIGNIYYEQADYPKALGYYLRALKMTEELGDKNKSAAILGNIGIVYVEQADYPKALDYYFKALKMAEELGDKKGVARHLGNIGIVYVEQADYPKALDYYFRALKMAEELGYKQLQANTLGNIGNVYAEQVKQITTRGGSNSFLAVRLSSRFNKALEYSFKALKMAEELGDKNGIARHLGNIGSLYAETKKYTEAEKYLSDALKLHQEIGVQDGERQEEELLSNLYEKMGRHQLALIHYKKAMALKDTIFSAEKDKEITRKEMNYEFEKKEAAAKAEADKQAAVAAAESRKQKIVIWFAVSSLLLVIVFSVFMFNRWRVTKKQKKIIEEKNKEILDSIRYAKRIQDALLPTEKYIDKTLKRLMKK